MDTVHRLNWVVQSCVNVCFDVKKVGNGREIRVHKVNRRLVIFPRIVIKVSLFPGIVFTK